MKRIGRIAALALLAASLLGPAGIARADEITPGLIAPAGATGTLATQVVNTTTQQHSYSLAVTGLPAGFKATFVESGPVVTSVNVRAGARAGVTLRVEIPAQATAGTYRGSIVATRDDGVALAMPLTLMVDDAYALTVTSAARNITALSGQDFTFDITVRNTGTQKITGLAPVVDMPPKWVPVPEPATVAELVPGAEATFHVRVSVPSSQVAIDQPVKVSVKAAEVSSAVQDMKVRVQSNPAFFPIAGTIVVLALAGVAIYFKRKGRR